MPSWWQTRIRVPSDLADAAAWLIAEALDHPVEMQDQTTMEKDASRYETALVIGFNQAPDENLEALVEAVMCQLGHRGALKPETRRRDDDDWQDGWKAFFKGVQLSSRIWAGPPWETPPSELIPVVIEPGLAFGTGTHPTTAGAMAMLDTLLGDRAPTHILDVGSGSGILSIAAAKLGHRVTGCEIDPVAVRNALENIEKNDVAHAIDMRVGSASDINEHFDIVVANIIAPVLLEIAEDIQARACHQLILSGLLKHQEEAVLNAYPRFELISRVLCGEWLVLYLEARR